jgi:hypothetical protein
LGLGCRNRSEIFCTSSPWNAAILRGFSFEFGILNFELRLRRAVLLSVSFFVARKDFNQGPFSLPCPEFGLAWF